MGTYKPSTHSKLPQTCNQPGDRSILEQTLQEGKNCTLLCADTAVHGWIPAQPQGHLLLMQLDTMPTAVMPHSMHLC
jgi:hypothetical protein